MAAPFRLGLIGAGRMGRTHLRGLAGSDQVAITAIAEVSAATRATVPDVGAAVYPGIAEMLDSETLDGVLIVVPTDRHLQVITEVAARGLPILCEKPCGLYYYNFSIHILILGTNISNFERKEKAKF